MCEIRPSNMRVVRPTLGHPGPPPPYDPAWRDEYIAVGQDDNTREALHLDILPIVDTRGPDHNRRIEEVTGLLQEVVVRTPGEGARDNRRGTPEGREAAPPEYVDPLAFNFNADNFHFNTTGYVHMTQMEPDDAGDIIISNRVKVNAKHFLDKRNKRSSGHVWQNRCSILGHIFLYSCIIGIIITLVNKHTVDRRIEEEGLTFCENHECHVALIVILPLILLILTALVVYIFLLCEVRFSDIRKYTKIVKNADEVLAFIQERRLVTPKVGVLVECWHTDKREGKVVTYRELANLPIRRCVDVSGNLDPLTFISGKITRFEVDKELGFLDDISHFALERLKKTMREKNEDRDIEIDVKVVLDIPGFQPYMSVCVDHEEPTKCMRPQYLWIFSCCLLSWCYRVWYRCETNRAKYTYMKLIGI